jgi:hypothetical protein
MWLTRRRIVGSGGQAADDKPFALAYHPTVTSTPPLPTTRVAPVDVASIVSRNLVPVAGLLLFGWSAPNLLVLYYVDMLFALASLLLLLMAHVTGFDGRGAGPVTTGTWLRGAAAALAAAVLIGAPLGVPLIIVLSEYRWSFAAAWHDPGFTTGLAIQAAASAWLFVQAHRELDVRTDDERVLKRHTGFLFGRWFVLLIAAMTGLPGVLGPRVGGFLLVAAYAGASIYFELFPERGLAWLNPKEAAKDDAG